MTNTDFTARCMAGKALEDVAGKQDVITDLDAIRAGAAAGATAVQPEALEDYQPKIDITHKLDADFVDDTNSTNKFATQSQLDQIGINENNILSFGYKTKEITLSSLNFLQATGGLFYTSSLLDYSSEFDVIYSVNLNGFNNFAGNWAVMFSVKPDTASYGIVIQDPTNPATLTVGSAVIRVLIFGKLKQS